MSERYKPPGGNEWFYFTNINPNGEGSGSERGGEYGYWKQTTGGSGGEEEIKSEEEGRKIIGYKKTLGFYQQQQQQQGSSTHPIPDGSDGVVETDWMMYEYRLADPDPHSLPLIQPPPPRPKRKRGQLQLHTFIFGSSSSSSSSSLPTRKIIGGGYNRKRASLLYQPSLSHPLARSLKPNRRIVQELITVANPPLPHPPILTTHDHNMRVQLHTYSSYSFLFSFFYSYHLYMFISCLLQYLDEYCTVLCIIFQSGDRGSTSSSSSSTSTNNASISSPSPGSSSNIPQVLELHTTTTTTDQTNDDYLTATGQIECLQEEFTDHAHNPFVNIPHTLQNQQQQEQPINVHEVPLQVLPPAGADDASTSTSTIPKLEHAPNDHTPHQDNGPFP